MWELIKDKKEYKCWINLDNMIIINKNYDIKNSVGKKIGFRCQYNEMPLQEKWLSIKDTTKDSLYIILENNVKLQFAHLKKDYNFIRCLNFSNLTKDTYKYIKNDEDKNRYIKSNDYIEVICPNCGNRKKVTFANLKYNKFSCDKCSDGISFPEKFISSVLNQLKIEYQKQFMFNGFKYMYDFYLPKYDCIIEVHGKQHYKDTGFSTFKEEHENDMIKYDLCVLNGYEYNKNFFIIDARESTLEWIKNKLLESKLSEIFDLTEVNWCECLEYASSSIQREIWEYWRIHVNENNELLSLRELAKKFNIKNSSKTVSYYLKNGNDCGKCRYNDKEQLSRSGSKGYYIIDVMNKKEYYKRNTLIAEKDLNINRGTITRNCQYHKNSNDYKLINKRFLCFYEEDYTSFEEIVMRYKVEFY